MLRNTKNAQFVVMTLVLVARTDAEGRESREIAIQMCDSGDLVCTTDVMKDAVLIALATESAWAKPSKQEAA